MTETPKESKFPTSADHNTDGSANPAATEGADNGVRTAVADSGNTDGSAANSGATDGGANASRKKRSNVSAAVVKAMGLFSGVQVINILFSVVRTKFVALWIGRAGIGVFGLYSSAFDMIVTLSQLGLGNSVIPTLAGSKSESVFARLALVVRRWYRLLGMLGAILTVLLSPALSRLAFGDSAHTLGFIILAAGVFLNSVTGCELAILRGAGLLKRLAKATIAGAAVGLAVSIPLYYYLGIDSIALSIAAYSAGGAVAAWLMRDRTRKPDPLPTARQTFGEGLAFVRLGIFMTASAFITLASTFAFMSYLEWRAGSEEVGLFQAGFTLANKYIGLVFTAIAMEFFPRLCKVKDSPRCTSLFVSHESLIAMAVILPCATLFMALDDVAIRLFYDSAFLPTAGYLSWALAGTSFRAMSWCMAFVILARGDGMTYIVTESLSSAAYVVLNIVAYNVGGITALGLAYVAWYALYCVIVGVVYFRRYRLTLIPGAVRLFAVTTAVGLACAALRTSGHRWAVVAVAVVAAAAGVVILKRLVASRRR